MSRLKTALRWVVTLGLLAALVLVVDVESVVAILLTADPSLLGLALLVALSDRAMMIGKWIPLARVLVPSVRIGVAVKAYFGASFASLFLPSSVGGDAVRAYAVGRDRDQVTEIAVSIVVERALGFIGLSTIVGGVLLLALGSVPEARRLLLWVLGAAALGGIVLVLPVVVGDELPFKRGEDGWWGRLHSLWNRMVTGYKRYADHPRLLAVVGLLSALEQLFPVAIVWVLARALDVPAGVFALALATLISMFLKRLPVAIDGIGVVEGALVYFLGLFGVDADQALAIAVANRAVTTIVVLPGAVFVSDLRARGPGGGGISSGGGARPVLPAGRIDLCPGQRLIVGRAGGSSRRWRGERACGSVLRRMSRRCWWNRRGGRTRCLPRCRFLRTGRG